jgi:hypothetical protein
VTELRVEDGALSVVIRDATGTERTIDTPYDPSREIYVDFAILDGRLWIRRVFDASTPPEEGLVIDPGLAEVDWSLDPESHGKAAYRSLEEGRWVVSVSGDGSLGLARPEPGDTPALSPPPAIQRHAPLDEAVGERLRSIRPEEALRALAERLGVVRPRGGIESDQGSDVSSSSERRSMPQIGSRSVMAVASASTPT